MKTLKIALIGIAIATGYFAEAQPMSPSGATKGETGETVLLSYQDQIEQEVEKIASLQNELQKDLTNETLQKEIAACQQTLMRIRDEAVAERNLRTAKANGTKREMEIYPINPEANSFRLRNFEYVFESVPGKLKVQFDTKETGSLNIRLLSPGSMVLAHEVIFIGEGLVQYTFDISDHGYNQYFLNIEMDGKSTTKKIAI